MVFQAAASLLNKAADHTYGAIMTGANMWYNSAMNEKQYHYNMNLQHDAQRWQERMSNTAHQREVKDLQLAGINPLYTATGGTGANVGGAGANSTSAHSFDIASPYMNALSTMSNIRNQTNATNADVALKGAQTQDFIGNLYERLFRIEEIKANTDLKRGQYHMLDWQQKEIQATIRNLNSLVRLNDTNASYIFDKNKREQYLTAGEQASSLNRLEQIKSHPTLSYMLDYLRGSRYLK